MALIVIGSAAVVFGLIAACVTVIPTWLVGPDAGPGALSRLDRLEAENDVRTSLLQGLAGLLALAGVGVGAAATLRQIRVNREGNTIGLFTKAIDQLSSDDVSVRQGGVYAMELLSKLDSAYRGPIHALLTAFVRQRIPWRPVADSDGSSGSERNQLHGGLPDDVGAAMAALSRRKMVEIGAWSELEKVDLRDAELSGRDFRQVCFLGSNLSGAKLVGANLSHFEAVTRHIQQHRPARRRSDRSRP
jgi:Pentapeptide repeats (8 copies)